MPKKKQNKVDPFYLRKLASLPPTVLHELNELVRNGLVVVLVLWLIFK